MRIIKVSATESTNSFARDWYHSHKSFDAVCIVAYEQTSGRGQRGAGWYSNAGENLTGSVIIRDPKIEISDQFLLSAGVGLAIIKALNELKINKLSLKWPNDIMAANFKIGGILIENILTNGRIGASIIGIGLNINQLIFPGLPQASSLKAVTDRGFHVEEVLQPILNKLEIFFSSLCDTSADTIIQEYEEKLFRRNKISTFQLPDGKLLPGIIKGITSTGLLKIQVEDNVIRTFDLKELKLLF